MKAKIGREIALLSLPVLIIGGVALWKTRAPRALLPAPVVSRVSEIELVRAAWLYNAGEHSFLVVVRHTASNRDELTTQDLQVLSCAVRDANQKPIALFYKDSKSPVPAEMMASNFGHTVIPRLPADQTATVLIRDVMEPRGGWGAVKQPIHVEAKISDGVSAPLTVRVTLRQQLGDKSSWVARTIR